MPSKTTFHYACAAAMLLAAGAHPAYAEDTIATDRPDFVESSQVVGKGRVQLETSVQWERQRDDEVHSRTLGTPTLLRIGVSDTTELRIETDGRTVVHASAASGAARSVAGYADTALGVKWHLADQEGEGFAGAPSLGVLLHADLASGSRELRGHGVRPSLRLAAEWDLADGYSFGVMPGVAAGATTAASATATASWPRPSARSSASACAASSNWPRRRSRAQAAAAPRHASTPA
jgi:hypothetical protein